MSMTSERPNLILPGLLPPDPSLERYWVRPGGVTVFMLAPDDRMTLVDVDGAQPAEITVIGADGSDDTGALGMKSGAPATAINSSHLPGMDPAAPRAVRVFGEYSPPGASQGFRAGAGGDSGSRRPWKRRRDRWGSASLESADRSPKGGSKGAAGTPDS